MMHSSDMPHSLPSKQTTARVVVLCFAAGWLGFQLFHYRDYLISVTQDAYLSKQRAMTSEPGAYDRYYVFHDPGTAIAVSMRRDPAIVKINNTPFERLSAVDIAPGNPSSVDRLRQLKGIHYTIKSRIPLICH